MLCYFVTTSMLKTMTIGDRVYELYWYQLSRSEQYIVRMIINRTQKPFHIRILGVFKCSLGTFLKVSDIFGVDMRECKD